MQLTAYLSQQAALKWVVTAPRAGRKGYSDGEGDSYRSPPSDSHLPELEPPALPGDSKGRECLPGSISLYDYTDGVRHALIRSFNVINRCVATECGAKSEFVSAGMIRFHALLDFSVR